MIFGFCIVIRKVLSLSNAHFSGELIDPKADKGEDDTEYKKTLSEYDEIRKKVIPLVEEEQQTNCICM